MKTVLALEPDNLEALSHLSYEKRQVCDWSDLGADLERFGELLAMAPHAWRASPPPSACCRCRWHRTCSWRQRAVSRWRMPSVSCHCRR